MLFFVEGTVSKSGPYILKPETINYRGIILADDHDQARMKFRKHWDDETREFDVYYRVIDFDVTEAIT